MTKFFNETLHKLETEITEIEAESCFQKVEAIINLIVNSLSELKEYVLKNEFQDKEEEIRFFKYQKPVIVAKLIFYNAIYKIETKRPYGAKLIKKYLNCKFQ